MLEAGLKRCASGATWERLTPEDLRASADLAGGDAFVLLSRHSGETPSLPKGIGAGQCLRARRSKPFLVAGVRIRNGAEPRLPSRVNDPEWQCGDHLPGLVDLATALLRSCNGYFLDWARQDPTVAQYGAFGAALLAIGLRRLPEDITEAIG